MQRGLECSVVCSRCRYEFEGARARRRGRYVLSGSSKHLSHGQTALTLSFSLTLLSHSLLLSYHLLKFRTLLPCTCDATTTYLYRLILKGTLNVLQIWLHSPWRNRLLYSRCWEIESWWILFDPTWKTISKILPIKITLFLLK